MNKPIGRCYLNMCLSLDILNIEHGINDYVICKLSNEIKTHRIKIQTSRRGHSFFRFQGRNYYLAEFLR